MDANTLRDRGGFLHHPREFPLQLHRRWWADLWRSTRPCASLGLCVTTDRPLPVGASVDLTIPLRGETQRFRGEVVLVRAVAGGYEIGVWLESERDAERARIVEQICGLECRLRGKKRPGSPASTRQSDRPSRQPARLSTT